MKVTQFKDEAQKCGSSIEAIRATFEDELNKGLIQGIISPDKAEAIYFEPNEIEDLVSELSRGKISLTNLAEQMNLTSYQIRLVIQHLLRTNRVKGEVTYSTFVAKVAVRKASLQKAKENKHNHRVKTINKQR